MVVTDTVAASPTAPPPEALAVMTPTSSDERAITPTPRNVVVPVPAASGTVIAPLPSPVTVAPSAM